MALRVRFRFDGKCCLHPRYNPEKDGRPKDGSCPGCESLFCVWLYTFIAERKAKNGEGLARQPQAAQNEDDNESKPPEANASAASSAISTQPESEPEVGVGPGE